MRCLWLLIGTWVMYFTMYVHPGVDRSGGTNCDVMIPVVLNCVIVLIVDGARTTVIITRMC